jgi:hypothetical protein
MLLQFKKEGVGEEESSSSSSSSPRAARGGRPQLDQLSSSSAGATDRLIQPGDKRETETTTQGRGGGRGRWKGRGSPACVGRQSQAGGAPVQSKSQSAITGFSVFSKQRLLVILVSLYFFFHISPSIFHVCIIISLLAKKNKMEL